MTAVATRRSNQKADSSASSSTMPIFATNSVFDQLGDLHRKLTRSFLEVVGLCSPYERFGTAHARSMSGQSLQMLSKFEIESPSSIANRNKCGNRQLRIWQCFQPALSAIPHSKLTPIGLGAWAIGGEWRFGWGPQDDADSIATIRRAIERGLNWIDTAAIYGLGHSEEVVGRALQRHPAERAAVRVHEVQPRVGRRAEHVAQPRAAIDSAGSRAEPAATADGTHRSVSDSLAGVAGESAGTRSRHDRRGMGDADEAER